MRTFRMADVQTPQEKAEERKARLQALKAKRTASEREKEDEVSSKPVLKFRNYNPHNEELKEKKLDRTKPESVETHVMEQLQAAGQAHVEEVNLSNLAPKKPDWDLKRDISKKSEILERRTQKAIIELIRKRLQEDSSALASAVASVDLPQPDEDDTND